MDTEENLTPEQMLDEELAPKSKEFLRELLKDALANQVFFSDQVRNPDLLPMVFMPLALGALSYPEPAPKLPDLPKRPEGRPVRPVWEPPVWAKKADVAAKNAELNEAKERLSDTEYKLRWNDATDDDVRIAREAVSVAQDRADNVQFAILQSAVEDHVHQRRAYMAQLQEFRAQLRAWRAASLDWAIQNAPILGQVVAWEARRKAYFDNLGARLGIIYGYYKDAGPRTINGYPIFFSMGVLNKTDWERLREVLTKELERRDSLEL